MVQSSSAYHVCRGELLYSMVQEYGLLCYALICFAIATSTATATASVIAIIIAMAVAMFMSMAMPCYTAVWKCTMPACSGML